MDTAVQLALMSKAKKVFGNNQTFLSFPVTPLPFTKQQLNFLADQNLQNLRAFSALVNLIPNGEAWVQTDPHYLWDVYHEVLTNANFATSTRTPEEEARYQAALRVLHTTREDGSREDTPAYQAYKQHKDMFLLAQQRYTAAAETAKYSSDPAEQQRWSTIDEPALRANLLAYETQWAIDGYKNQIETAQNTITTLEARSPLLTLGKWSSLFMDLLDTVTDAVDLSSAFSSSFAPPNALEEGSWQPFKLTSDEVKALVAEAPADIRSRLSINTDTLSVGSLVFEFSSAVIQRPWFVPDAFTARFWQFSDTSKIISDGKAPASGECPAYVTAIVFARNVTVEKKQAQPGQPPVIPFDGFNFPIATNRLRVFPAGSVKPNPRLIDTQIQFPHGAVLPQSMTRMTANPPVTLSEHMLETRLASRDSVISRVDPSIATARLFRDLEIMAFPRQPAREQSSGAAEPPPPPSHDDSIYILAFICKQVPLSPNPDPNLQW